MADGHTLTRQTPYMDISSVPQWHVFDVVFDSGATGTTECDLITLPIGTVVCDMKLQCIVAETDATSTVAHIRLETGPIVLLTGTADNMGTVGTEVKEMELPSTFPTATGLAAANVLQMQTVVVGTSTIGGTGRLSILMFRIHKP